MRLDKQRDSIPNRAHSYDIILSQSPPDLSSPMSMSNAIVVPLGTWTSGPPECPPIHPRICPPDVYVKCQMQFLYPSGSAIRFYACLCLYPCLCPPDVSSQLFSPNVLPIVLTIVLPICPHHLFVKHYIRSQICS